MVASSVGSAEDVVDVRRLLNSAHRARPIVWAPAILFKFRISDHVFLTKLNFFTVQFIRSWELRDD
jgi:hypothetical protein